MARVVGFVGDTHHSTRWIKASPHTAQRTAHTKIKNTTHTALPLYDIGCLQSYDRWHIFLDSTHAQTGCSRDNSNRRIKPGREKATDPGTKHTHS
jgi:hypothetical protein